jgi:hypothetical protein
LSNIVKYIYAILEFFMPIPENPQFWQEHEDFKAAKKTLLDKYKRIGPIFENSESLRERQQIAEVVRLSNERQISAGILRNAATHEFEIVPVIVRNDVPPKNDQSHLVPLPPKFVHQLPKPQRLALINAVFSATADSLEKSYRQTLTDAESPYSLSQLEETLEELEKKYAQLLSELPD